MSDADIIEIKQRLADVEYRLAKLEGTPLPATPDADPEVLEHVRRGDLIRAIKRYREITGAGLREAKEAVERLT